jgi:hypothetical protein
VSARDVSSRDDVDEDDDDDDDDDDGCARARDAAETIGTTTRDRGRRA